MKTYELLLIAKTDVEATEKALTTVVKKLLGNQPVTIKEVAVWGKKQLAYEIKKQKEGVYALFTLEADALKVGEIENQAKLGTDVLRFMLTVK